MQRQEGYNLVHYLYPHACERLQLRLPTGFFETALATGRCLVCLDDLDEVGTAGQRQLVVQAVQALAHLYPQNRYVVTSRVVGYEEAPLDRADFAPHTVLPLTDDGIREFVRKWYTLRERDVRHREERIADLIGTLERETRIRELARNLLLLTIIALVHRIEATLPHERVKLYEKCVTALVDTWDEVRGVTVEDKQRPFYRYRVWLLERLGYELQTRADTPDQAPLIGAGDLELLLRRFLRDNPTLNQGPGADLRREACDFIRLACARTGLLVERGHAVFGFAHPTFQEYLAARDIETRTVEDGVAGVWQAIRPRLHDARWGEVVLLLIGSLGRYSGFPTRLVQRILDAGMNDPYEPVLHRHLHLAARILADRVTVADEVRRRIVDELRHLARSGAQPPG